MMVKNSEDICVYLLLAIVILRVNKCSGRCFYKGRVSLFHIKIDLGCLLAHSSRLSTCICSVMMKTWVCFKILFRVIYKVTCLWYNTAMCAKLLWSCATLFTPMDHSPLSSSVHGILQTRIWRGLPCLLPRDFPNPGIKSVPLVSPTLAGRFFTTNSTWEAWGDPYCSYKPTGFNLRPQRSPIYRLFTRVVSQIYRVLRAICLGCFRVSQDK